MRTVPGQTFSPSEELLMMMMMMTMMIDDGDDDDDDGVDADGEDEERSK